MKRLSVAKAKNGDFQTFPKWSWLTSSIEPSTNR